MCWRSMFCWQNSRFQWLHRRKWGTKTDNCMMKEWKTSGCSWWNERRTSPAGPVRCVGWLSGICRSVSRSQPGRSTNPTVWTVPATRQRQRQTEINWNPSDSHTNTLTMLGRFSCLLSTNIIQPTPTRQQVGWVSFRIGKICLIYGGKSQGRWPKLVLWRLVNIRAGTKKMLRFKTSSLCKSCN